MLSLSVFILLFLPTHSTLWRGAPTVLIKLLLVQMSSILFIPLTWLLLVLPCVVRASFLHPATMLTATKISKPGCRSKCGNLTIPYPFGVRKGCAMGDEYIVRCYTGDGYPKPEFLESYSEVLHISETQVLIAAGPVASSCNTRKQGDGDVWGSLDMSSLPYAMSSTANKFVVTGCSHYGLIEDQTKGKRQLVSCVALCTNEMDLGDSACSGIGCCQAPIPVGLRKFETRLEKIYYQGNVSSGNCSYAFLAERSSFKYNGAIDLQDLDFPKRIENLPVMLDWFVTNKTCRDAQRNRSTYACQKNANCIDLIHTLKVKGYRCKCREGYEGNPYLSPGCTDINECSGQDSPCSDSCDNMPGSYYCSCPSGYHGDGRKDGTACRPKNLRFIFALGIAIGLGSILFLLAIFWIFLTARRRKVIIQKAKNFKQNGGLLLQQQMSSQTGLIEKTKVFTASELEKATDNYNVNRVLGDGGQGTVYKGMLNDGSMVAIKRSKKVDQKHSEQFINEVVILSQINHRNILKLLGCCLETEVPLLVYEYVPNGTLFQLLHDPSEDFPVTWEMRLQIAVDVAGALNYLHSASSKPIFHRDIKTSNVLLDEKYKAKLSDFGTSRSIEIDQTHLTTQVQGTFGYLDPEYFRSNQFTDKSDVYSFGVVLVELLTGQQAIRPTESSNGEGLASWFLKAMENSDLNNILAVRVLNEARKEAADAVANLAKECLNMDGRDRPTMKEAALELEVISRLCHEPVSLLSGDNDLMPSETVDRTSNGLSPADTSHTDESSMPSS